MVMKNGPPTTSAATLEAESATVFESPVELSPGGRTGFFSDGLDWETLRDSGVDPWAIGPLAGDGPHRDELIEGARLLGFDRTDLKPQQLLMADALNAPGLDRFTVEAMRRSSKSTSIFAWILGHLHLNPGKKAVFSAQSGVMSGRMFRDWAMAIDRVAPPDPLADVFSKRRSAAATRARHAALFGDVPGEQTQASGPGFRIFRAAGQMGIEWDHGSTFRVLKPDAEAFRSQAADIIWLDEAQELEVEQGEELLAGILPLMDTRPDARVIISGTAGAAQVGIFWDHINRLRRKDQSVGGIDYAADPLTPWADLQNEDTAMQLLERVHPGVNTLTTMDKMRGNYRGLTLPKWAREYLSLWPETSGDVAIPADQWDASMLSSRPRKPERVALGLAIAPGGTTACIAAAWRTSKGIAHVEIVEHRLGTRWIPDVLPGIAQRARASVAVDLTPEAGATVTELERARNKPRVTSMRWQTINAACVQVMRDLERGTLRHQDQQMLNHAATHATRREVRGQTQAWLWGSADGEDVTPLVAATIALRQWDETESKRGQRATIVTSAA